MPYQEKLRKAVSTGNVSYEFLKSLHDAGIEAIEYSALWEGHFVKVDFPRNAEKIAEDAKRAGIELWSIHLPFSANFDIAGLNNEIRRMAIECDKVLIEAAGKIGMKVAVIHPSSEPIADDTRAERMRRAREGIIELSDFCHKFGMELAVEDIPRTCLTSVAEEMIALVKDTGAKVVYDTNHCLTQTNYYYINKLTEAGIKIVSLHISDYDFVNERHLLPGGSRTVTEKDGTQVTYHGYNNWTSIFEALEKNGYDGPLLYETWADLPILVDNMNKLQKGEIK